MTYAASGASVIVDLGAGTGRSGDADSDVIREIETLVGSDFGDTLIGGGDADILMGGGGDDFIFANGAPGEMTSAEVVALLDASRMQQNATVSTFDLELSAGVDPLLGL